MVRQRTKALVHLFVSFVKTGVCLGLQVAVIEFARNVLGWEDAHSEEFVKTPRNVVRMHR